MERLNLNTKLEGVESKDLLKKTKEAFVEFFTGLLTEEYKEAGVTAKEIKARVNNEIEKYIIDTSYVDPRVMYADAYCVLTQSALDRLLALGEDYVVVDKEDAKVKGLKKHKKIVGTVYHISLKEESNDYKGGVTVHVTLNTTPGAYDFIKLMFLEDEIYYTKACLDSYDVQF